MLFEKKFKVVEIYNSDVIITNYLKGNRRTLKKDIEAYKDNSKKYEMVGKDGMIVWY